MGEIWKDIEDYEGLYQVSNLGRVKSLARKYKVKNRWGSYSIRTHAEKIIKNHLDSKDKYVNVCLCKNGHGKFLLLHRLVAVAFIPNPENKEDVNRIDGNKRNNIIYNLEWNTRSENLKHALSVGLIESQCKIRRKVIVKKESFEKKFDSMKDCSNFFGRKDKWLSCRSLRCGRSFKYKGYDIIIGDR